MTNASSTTGVFTKSLDRVLVSRSACGSCWLDLVQRSDTPHTLMKSGANAYNHSAQPIDIRLRAEGGAQNVCLCIRSRIEEGKEWVVRDRVALPAATASNPAARRSFLMRFADVEHVLNGGLSIMTRIVRDHGEWYEAEITGSGR
jgi:hypothetical protein